MRICNIRDVRCHADRLYALIIIDMIPQKKFGTASEGEGGKKKSGSFRCTQR